MVYIRMSEKDRETIPGEKLFCRVITAVGGPIFAFAGSSRGEIIAVSHKFERRNRRNV